VPIRRVPHVPGGDVRDEDDLLPALLCRLQLILHPVLEDSKGRHGMHEMGIAMGGR
jgi:hypothetical protein